MRVGVMFKFGEEEAEDRVVRIGVAGLVGVELAELVDRRFGIVRVRVDVGSGYVGCRWRINAYR
jgi:hypothetical protein